MSGWYCNITLPQTPKVSAYGHDKMYYLPSTFELMSVFLGARSRSGRPYFVYPARRAPAVFFLRAKIRARLFGEGLLALDFRRPLPKELLPVLG